MPADALCVCGCCLLLQALALTLLRAIAAVFM
jgi:hypothetical protein